jgi:hypothetical protein
MLDITSNKQKFESVLRLYNFKLYCAQLKKSIADGDFALTPNLDSSHFMRYIDVFLLGSGSERVYGMSFNAYLYSITITN